MDNEEKAQEFLRKRESETKEEREQRLADLFAKIHADDHEPKDRPACNANTLLAVGMILGLPLHHR